MSVSDPERFAWLQLARTEGLGPVTVRRLVQRAGSAVKAVEMVPVLSERGGRIKNLAPADAIRKEIDELNKRNTPFLCPADKAYPFLLAQIHDAPLILTYRGRVELLNKALMAGMVGARNASVNACRLTQKWAGDLGNAGAVVVSGLARGIDTAAHQGSLKTGTVAVVAGGLDNIYPAENQKLADQIAVEGCIVSEELLNLAPMATHFPKRNRIISGLSHGVVVVEATLRSGSLITARVAGEQGREVMAVPGFPADPRAQGPNSLLKDGATLIENAEDIINALRTHRLPAGQEAFLLEEQAYIDTLYDDSLDNGDIRARILSSLSMMPISLDELANVLSCKPQNLSLALLELELAGAIRYVSQGQIALGSIEK